MLEHGADSHRTALEDGAIERWLRSWKTYNVGGKLTGKTLRRARTICAWILGSQLAASDGTPQQSLLELHDFLFAAISARENVNGGASLFSDSDSNAVSNVQFVKEGEAVRIRTDALAAVIDLMLIASAVKAVQFAALAAGDYSVFRQGQLGANTFATSLVAGAEAFSDAPAPLASSSKFRGGAGQSSGQIVNALVCSYASIEAACVRAALRSAVEAGAGDYRSCLEVYYFLATASGGVGAAAIPDGMKHISQLLFQDVGEITSRRRSSTAPADKQSTGQQHRQQQADGHRPKTEDWQRRLTVHPVWSRPLAAFFLCAHTARDLHNMFLLDNRVAAATCIPEFLHIQGWLTTPQYRKDYHVQPQFLQFMRAPVIVALLAVQLFPYVTTNDVLAACLPQHLRQALVGIAQLTHTSSSCSRHVEMFAGSLRSFVIHGLEASQRASSPQTDSDRFNLLTLPERFRLLEAAFRFVDYVLRSDQHFGAMLYERRLWLVLKLGLSTLFQEVRSTLSSLSAPADVVHHEPHARPRRQTQDSRGTTRFLMCDTSPLHHTLHLLDSPVPGPDETQWLLPLFLLFKYSPGIHACRIFQISGCRRARVEEGPGDHTPPTRVGIASQDLVLAWLEQRVDWLHETVDAFLRGHGDDATDSASNEQLAALLLMESNKLAFASISAESPSFRDQDAVRRFCHAVVVACLPNVRADCLATELMDTPSIATATTTYCGQLLPVEALLDICRAMDRQHEWPKFASALRRTIFGHIHNSRVEATMKTLGPRERLLLAFVHVQPPRPSSSNTDPHATQLYKEVESFLQNASVDVGYAHRTHFAGAVTQLLQKLRPQTIDDDADGSDEAPTNMMTTLRAASKVLTQDSTAGLSDAWESNRRAWGLKVNAFSQHQRQQPAVAETSENHESTPDDATPKSDDCLFCGHLLLGIGDQPGSDTDADANVVAYSCGHCYHAKCDLGFCFTCAEAE